MMRLVLAAVAFLFMGSGQQPGLTVPASWTTRTAPHHIIGNIYYVGTVDLASYLITTPAGHILIDTGLEQNADAILASIRKLTFDPRDIRLLLTTQAHFDHVGAHARIKQVSGAQVVVSAADRDVLEGGGKGDYHFGPRYYFPPVEADRLVHEGGVISLGGVSLTARLTPGHTKGTTTWTMVAREADGRLRHVVFMGSTSVNEGVKLVDNRTYPFIASDYERSFRVLRGLTCEVFLAAHASAFGGPRKAEAVRAGAGEEAFVDPEGCRAAVEGSERAFQAELARQRLAPGGGSR
jgi:metallo-beta-lactamase class B